jgi:flagellar hook-associated protein 2
MTITTSSPSPGLGPGAAGSGRPPALHGSATQSLLARNPGIKTIDAQLSRDDARLSSLGKLALALDTFRTAAGNGEVKVASDPAALGARVKEVVAAYNAMNGKLAALRSGDAASDTALNQVTAHMNQVLDGADRNALAAMGITRKGGALALDDAKLKTAIAADPERVIGMFAASGGGLASQLAKRAGQQIARGGAVANQAVALQQEVGKLIDRKAMITDAVTRQAAMLVQQYALAGDGQVRPTSAFDFLA